jgi:hypothetical protein
VKIYFERRLTVGWEGVYSYEGGIFIRDLFMRLDLNFRFWVWTILSFCLYDATCLEIQRIQEVGYILLIIVINASDIGIPLRRN